MVSKPEQVPAPDWHLSSGDPPPLLGLSCFAAAAPCHACPTKGSPKQVPLLEPGSDCRTAPYLRAGIRGSTAPGIPLAPHRRRV